MQEASLGHRGRSRGCRRENAIKFIQYVSIKFESIAIPQKRSLQLSIINTDFSEFQLLQIWMDCLTNWLSCQCIVLDCHSELQTQPTSVYLYARRASICVICTSAGERTWSSWYEAVGAKATRRTLALVPTPGTDLLN